MLLSFCILSELRASNSTDPKAAASSIYQQFYETISKPGKIEERYINPLVGGSVKLYTIDSSTSGSVKMFCPSGGEFLTVLVQPTNTGDLDVKVFWDSNKDGKLDKYITFDGLSGICTNGFIKCTPGTWNGCGYYAFKYVNGNLFSEETAFSSLSGCFCINNNCGDNLFWKNSGFVLKILGGAIAQAFQKSDPSFAISSVIVDGPSIKFYGQSPANCLDVQGGSLVSGLTNYYSNPALLLSDAQSLYYSSLSDTQSTAYLVTSVANRMNDTLEEKRCVKRRVISTRKYNLSEIFSRSTDCFGNVPGPYICGNKCLYFEFGVYQASEDSGSATITFEMTPDFYKILDKISASWRTDTSGPYPCFDDDGHMYFYLNGKYSGGKGYGDAECGKKGCGCCSCAPTHWVTLDKSLIIPPPNENTSSMNILHVEAGGFGGGYGVAAGCRPIKVYFTLTDEFKGCYITNDMRENGCIDLENDSTCVLWEEKIDGVITYMNGQKTGLYPLVKCNTFCDKIICDNEWLVERVYKCKYSQSETDFTKRLETISSSIMIDRAGGKIEFTDARFEKSSWNMYPGQMFRFNLESLSGECEPVCKLKLLSPPREVETNFYIRGSSTSREFYIYKLCQRVEGQYVCPVNDGEQVVTDCSCLDNFNEAIAALQALRLAGNDFICSSGIEKAF